MHDLDAIRIFWKEWRAQRSFWLGLLALAVGLEFLLVVVPPMWRPHVDPIDQLRVYQTLGIILSCAFATGSAAIAFAGEVESKTKGLLQRIPLRTRDLLAGKLSLSVLGSYLLLLVIWIAGGIMLLQSAQTPIPSTMSVEASREIGSFARLLAWPCIFVVVSGLFSLILTDVLLTVIIAGLAAAILMWAPGVHEYLTIQGGLIVAVALCDFFLARRWIQSTGGFNWPESLSISFPQIAIRQSVWLDAAPSALESQRSAVAWRRAAGSLLWKEFRQAFVLCVVILVAGVIAEFVYTILAEHLLGRNNLGFLVPVILIVFAPLLPGVAAMWAERRGSGYRLLVNQGIAADGFLLCKHAVWLSLSLAVFATLLIFDRGFVTARSGVNQSPLWSLAEGIGYRTFHSGIQIDSDGLVTETNVAVPFAVAAFHVVLLYALGFLLTVLLPGPVVACFAGAIVAVGIAMGWTGVAVLGIPFSWTIGLLPVIFLAVAWLRTSDWLSGRNDVAARVRAAALFVGSLVAILAGIIVFRLTEIPAAAFPAVPPQSDAARAGSAEGNRSLFVDALNEVTGPPRVFDSLRGGTIFPRWSPISEAIEPWIERNTKALNTAVAASRLPPGSFSALGRTDSIDHEVIVSNGQRLWWLAELLVFSARKLENEDRLDEAYNCYVALARLGNDAALSDWKAPRMLGDGFLSLALDRMQRWAASPIQTTARVKKAIREFESLVASNASSATLVKRWQADRRELRESLSRPPADPSARAVCQQAWVRWLTPWELARLERLLNAFFEADLNETAEIDWDLNRQGFVTATPERVAQWSHDNLPPWKFERTTLDPPEPVKLESWGAARRIDRLATERMYLIGLALADFQRVHEKLPNSLSALVPDYFERLPVDPWRGGQFIYEPRGVPTPIKYDDSEQFSSSKPFLASTGMLDTHYIRNRDADNTIESSFTATGEMKKRRGHRYWPAPLVPLPFTRWWLPGRD
jgi:hypothetical protein